MFTYHRMFTCPRCKSCTFVTHDSKPHRIRRHLMTRLVLNVQAKSGEMLKNECLERDKCIKDFLHKEIIWISETKTGQCKQKVCFEIKICLSFVKKYVCRFLIFSWFTNDSNRNDSLPFDLTRSLMNIILITFTISLQV